MKGYVVDSETLGDVSGVHIYDSKGRLTVSDPKGFFKLNTTSDDTLTFSRVDYEKKVIALKGVGDYSSLVISLTQRTYVLDTFEILSQYPIAKELLRPEQKVAQIDGVTKIIEPEKDYHMGLEAIASPATALYRLFSKSYKEEKKVHELEIEQAKENALREQAYVRIEEMLEINDVYLPIEEYEDLLNHCNLSYQYIINSNNYYLYLRMEDCLKEFIEQKDD